MSKYLAPRAESYAIPTTNTVSNSNTTRRSILRHAIALGIALIAVVSAAAIALISNQNNTVSKTLGGSEQIGRKSRMQISKTLYNYEMMPLSLPIPINASFEEFNTQEFDDYMENQIDYFDHQDSPLLPLLLEIQENGEITNSVELEYRLFEPEKGSHLKANIRKFETLKESISNYYPKLKHCSIRTMFYKTGMREYIEFRVNSLLKPKHISNETIHNIMPKDAEDLRQQSASFDGIGPEPAIGHIGFLSPGLIARGNHWTIVVTRTDYASGYFPFAQLTGKSYRILENLTPRTKIEKYEMCLTFPDLL